MFFIRAIQSLRLYNENRTSYYDIVRHDTVTDDNDHNRPWFIKKTNSDGHVEYFSKTKGLVSCNETELSQPDFLFTDPEQAYYVLTNFYSDLTLIA